VRDLLTSKVSCNVANLGAPDKEQLLSLGAETSYRPHFVVFVIHVLRVAIFAHTLRF